MRAINTERNSNGCSWEVDGSPASMVATLFSPTIYTPNYAKRLSRVERLKREIKAEVYYPMSGNEISIRYGENEWGCFTLRKAEQILRWLKSTSQPNEDTQPKSVASLNS